MELTRQMEICSLTAYKDYATKSLDISFHDISYTVGKGKNAKRILHQISGAFNSGQLTAILGPSGAGKSSLMNILAGLKKNGVEGCVEVNGEKQEIKTFRKQSAYITQKDHLLQDLSVDEYMMSAAHLKLGNNVSNKEKKLMIEMILKTLGLTNSQRTRISNLSGGECKRLSIGLELFDNPAVLFLDEPTSGLDSSSSMQCIALLREIAKSGRTVVATIHQPSSRLLDHFDSLYIVANGSCIYQGPTGSLVSYLKKFNLNCPSYHNPADFVIDVAAGEYGNVLFQLTSGVENGRLIYNDLSESTILATPSQEEIRKNSSIKKISKNLNKIDQEKNSSYRRDHLAYAAPFHTQVSVLFNRTWQTILREKMLTKVRFVTHVGFALFVGLVYLFIGNNAALTLNNAGMLFFNQVFIVFTAVMPTIVTFPMERKVLFREHLNHWYSLKAYYFAKLLVDIPFQIIFPTVYLVIVYFLTNQPLSLLRFSMLLFITICMALVGQGVGLFFGTAFGIQSAVFLGPTCAIPFFLFSGFFINLNSVPPYLSWITQTSFFRFGFEGSMLAIYDYERPPLECAQPYCYFRSPHKFLESFAMEQSSYLICIIGMLSYFVVLRFSGYFLLRFKLKTIR